MEERISRYIEDELYDDAIILAEEENNLCRDEKWLILIAKALFREGLYYRSILCLNECSQQSALVLKAKCYCHLSMDQEAISLLESITDETLVTPSILKLMGDIYVNLGIRDMAKSSYISSYQKDPYLLSVRKALHRLDIYVEEKESEEVTPSLAIRSLGLQDIAVVRHVAPAIGSSPLSFYSQFQHAYNHSQYQDAFNHFMSLRSVCPWWSTDLDSFSSILYVLHREGDLAALTATVERYEAERPQTGVIRGNLAALRDPPAALAIFKSLAKSFPRYMYAQYLLGDELLQRGDAAGAADCFRGVIRLSPTDARGWLGLGSCSLLTDAKTAVIYCRQALRLFPSCMNAHCMLVQALLQGGNLQAAQTAITAASSIDSTHTRLILLQAQLLKLQKRYEEAISFYNKLLYKSSLEVSVYVDMAQCYHEMGDVAESKRLLFLAGKMDSQNQHAIMTLLKSYQYEEG